MQQATLAIIKPDATKKNIIGQILQRAENADLKIVAMRLIHLSKREVEGFYYVHRERPFFGSLTDFMSEGPIVVIALRGEDAIPRWRELMGKTNPTEADPGTIRKVFAENIERNCVHGSDSQESAEFENGYFFRGLELVS